MTSDQAEEFAEKLQALLEEYGLGMEESMEFVISPFRPSVVEVSYYQKPGDKWLKLVRGVV